MMRLRVAVTAALTAVLFGSTACSSTPSTKTASSGGTSSPSRAAATSSPAPATTTVTVSRPATVASSAPTDGSARSAQAASGRLPTCSTATTRLSATDLTEAGGNFGVAIRMTNTSRTACHTYGYPGVAVLDAAGHQQFQAQRTLRGYFGGESSGTPRNITLTRGATATALLEGADRSEPGGTACPSDRAILITPPDTEKSAQRSAKVFVCKAPKIHPFVRGTHGSD